MATRTVPRADESCVLSRVVVPDEEGGRPFVTPGQVQFVVYSGGSVA